jgi:hypothetical protein
MRRHRDVEWDTSSEIHELFAISTRQIGDGSNDPLAPKDLVGHGRDRAHVDPAEDERAAFAKLPEGDRDQISDWRKDDRGIGSLRCGLVCAAGPFATERTGEVLSLDITGTREGEDPPALMPRNLGHDMRGGTKAEDGQSLCWTCCLQGTIPDEPCTQQGRGVKIVVD